MSLNSRLESNKEEERVNIKHQTRLHREAAVLETEAADWTARDKGFQEQRREMEEGFQERERELKRREGEVAPRTGNLNS